MNGNCLGATFGPRIRVACKKTILLTFALLIGHSLANAQATCGIYSISSNVAIFSWEGTTEWSNRSGSPVYRFIISIEKGCPISLTKVTQPPGFTTTPLIHVSGPYPTTGQHPFLDGYALDVTTGTNPFNYDAIGSATIQVGNGPPFFQGNWPNPFTFTIGNSAKPRCTYTVSSTTTSFGPNGGPGTANVTAIPDPFVPVRSCTWSASANFCPWITGVSATSSFGNGSVNFTAQPTVGGGSCSLTIAGQNLSITEGSAEPNLTITSVAVTPATTPPGGTIMITDTTANVGTVAAAASTNHYYLKDAGTGVQTVITTTRPVPALTANESNTKSVEATVPQNIAPGDYYAVVCVDPVSGETNTADNCRTTTTTIRITGVDLRIVGVRPVQVVYKSDLVEGKATSFEITVHAEGCASLPLNGIDVKLMFDGSTVTMDTIPLAAFDANTCDAMIHIDDGFQPSKGLKEIVLIVDPEDSSHPHGLISETNETNNELRQTVNVRTTRSLKVLFVKIPGSTRIDSCYFAPFMFDETVRYGNEFVSTLYPVSDLGFEGPISPISFYGTSIALPFGLSSDLDLINLYRFGKKQDSTADKIIGVVDVKYFACNGLPNTLLGLAYPYTSVGLVAGGAPVAVPHELGHMFGLGLLGEEYDESTGFPGFPARGYWVAGKKPVDDAICFMGNKDPDKPLASLKNWIDPIDYQSLLDSFIVSSDPEALVISGFLHSDGTIELAPWDLLTQASITDFDFSNTPSLLTYTIRSVDRAGAVLSQIVQPVAFMRFNEPGASQRSERIPLTVTLPFPKETAKVEIVKNGQVLLRLEPVVKLLNDAIDAIPDGGFVINPEQRRKALHLKVNAIARMIEAGAITGAIEALSHDLRERIADWTLDHYVLTNPLQMTRGQLLALIDNVRQRLATAYQ